MEIELMPVKTYFRVPTEPQPLDGAYMANAILDEVGGDLDKMMQFAAEMLFACACIIERELGPGTGRALLRTASSALAEKRLA